MSHSHAAAEGKGQTHHPEAAVGRLLRSLYPQILLRERSGRLQTTAAGGTCGNWERFIVSCSLFHTKIQQMFGTLCVFLTNLVSFMYLLESPLSPTQTSAVLDGVHLKYSQTNI